MIITMGKLAGRPRAALPRFALRLAPLAAGAMLLASECRADWRIQPSVTLTERYTDNAVLQSDNRQEQFITELTPAIAVTGRSSRYTVVGTAQARYFAYSGAQPPNTLDNLVEYGLAGQGTVIDDLLFVEASATQAPRSISAFGPQADSTPYLGANRTQLRTWRVSPFLQQRFGNMAHMVLRYARDSVDTGDFDPFGKSVSDSVTASLNSGTAFQSLGWGLTYLRQDLDSDIAGDTSTQTAQANLRYALTRRFALTATVGYDRYDYDALGGDTAGNNWSAGFDWTPSQRTRLSAAMGRHFYGNTGKLDASHRSRHTAWNINYDDAITTSREQFLLPSTIDAAAMLDSLFAATIADPLLRQQAVAEYLRTTGLPANLANNVNFLSNRYLRQKLLRASMGYNRARSTAAVSLFRTERIALSSQQTDSALLGSQLANLNDNVKEHGVNMSYSYRLSPRSNLLATASYTLSRSISTRIEDQRRDYRIAYSRQVGRRLRGTVELHRLSGGFGINSGTYRENGIIASLSAQL